MADPLNWSEWGNTDACVAISALTGLVYGGFTAFPLGIYTIAEGLALEATVYPRVGDYSTLIPAVRARYGLTIRALSTGTLSDAVTRAGIGLILAGWGSIPGTNWYDPNFQQFHSVFVIPKPPGKVLLFDPMTANMTQGQLINASVILNWAKGASVNDAREIREYEFGTPPAPVGVKMAIRPVREDWATGTGPTGGQFFLDGPGVGSPLYFISSENVRSIGETTDGLWRIILYSGGDPSGQEYLWMRSANLLPVTGSRKPATGYALDFGIPAEDVAKLNNDLAASQTALQSASAALAATKAQLVAKSEELSTAITQGQAQITSLKAQIVSQQAVLAETVARVEQAEGLSDRRNEWLENRPRPSAIAIVTGKGLRATINDWLTWINQYPQ